MRVDFPVLGKKKNSREMKIFGAGEKIRTREFRKIEILENLNKPAKE
jgi:hypothetical protein